MIRVALTTLFCMMGLIAAAEYRKCNNRCSVNSQNKRKSVN